MLGAHKHTAFIMDATKDHAIAGGLDPNKRDPLDRLGSSLFLSVVRHLPFEDLLGIEPVCKAWRRVLRGHARGIWLPACYDSGVEPSVIDSLRASERAASKAVISDDTPVSDLGESGHGSTTATVDWRDICRTHVEHERNWRFGRTRERWITPEHNTVWRIKVDLEERTLISTSRMRTLRAVSAEGAKELRLTYSQRG